MAQLFDSEVNTPLRVIRDNDGSRLVATARRWQQRKVETQVVELLLPQEKQKTVARRGKASAIEGQSMR
jgi:hypothetical protein